MLTPTTSWILVIFYLLSAVILIALIGGLAYLLAKLNATLEAYQAKLDPLLNQAEAFLALANEKVDTIGGKTDQILTQGVETAGSIHEKVEVTASSVQRTVNAPLIGINALSAGLTRGFKVFGALQKNTVQPEPVVVVVETPVAVVVGPFNGRE